MAASFIGCTRATTAPDRWPVQAVSSAKTAPKSDATAMLLTAIRCSRRRSRYQAQTPTTKRAARVNDETTVWRNLSTATGERATSRNEVISLRTLCGSNAQPTGCCIHALAAKIQNAERLAPRAVSQVEAR